MQKFWKIAWLIVLLVMTTTVAANDALPPAQDDAGTGVLVEVVPEEGTQGATHDILIEGLDAGQSIVVQIDDPADTTVYTSDAQTADDAGQVELEIFTTDDDATGTYTVSILDGNTVLATTTFEVAPPEIMAGTVTVTPDVAPADTEHVIEVAGVVPFTDLTVAIVNEAGSEVFASSPRSDADGNAVVEFATNASVPSGEYTVVVTDVDVEIATTTFVIEQAAEATEEMAEEAEATEEATEEMVDEAEPTEEMTEAGVVVMVTPASGERGTQHVIAVSGLEAETTLMLELILAETGEVVFSTERAADADGNFELTLASGDGQATGTYTVSISVSEEVVGEGAFTILAEGEVLAEETEVAAEPTEETEVAAEPTEEVAEETEAPAEATIESAQVEETEAPADTADVVVTVDPASGVGGTAHTISVSGLEAEAVFTIELVFDDSAIFSSERTADADGNFSITLASGEDDTPGDYAVNVLVDGDIVGEGVLVIADAAAEEIVEEAEETEVAAEPTEDMVEEAATEEATSSVVVMVDPASGVGGTAHTISVSGLEADAAFTLELVFDDSAIFSSERTADADGNFSITLASGENDPTGDYAVNVLVDGDIVGEGVLVIADAAAEVTEAPAEPTEVMAEPTEEMAEETEAPAEETPAEEATEAPAEATPVDMMDATEEPDFEGDPVSNVPSIEVAPDTMTAEEATIITVSDLMPEETVTVTISTADTTVDTREVTADVNGNAVFRFVSEETLALGDYTIAVLRDGVVVVEASLTVIEAEMVAEPEATETPTEAQAVTLTIVPETGPIGTEYTITVTGLAPDSTATLNVIRDGAVILPLEAVADANGSIVRGIVSEEGDPEGPYSIELVQDDAILATVEFEIAAEAEVVEEPETSTEAQVVPDEEDAPVAITIDPTAGDIGTTYVITVSNLQPNQMVTLDVSLDDSVVFTTERETDPNGTVILQLQSSAGDPEGVYVVTVSDANGELVTGAFGVGADVVVETPDVETPTAAIAIVVEPESGEPGTIHVVTVSGLEADETVGINVLLAGEIVFETERTADAAGQIELSLSAGEDDPTGEYTVQVLRNGEVMIQAALIVEGDEVVSGVSIDIEPASGPAGTEHIVTVSGLEAGEVVTLNVAFNDTLVFTSELVADADGVTGIVLTSEESDELGDYDITVERVGAVIASDTLTITDGDAVVDATEEAPTSAADLIEGELTNDAPAIEYTFSGEEGESVIISLNSIEFDPYLILLDDEGNELAVNDDSSDSLNSQIVFTLPYTGEYVIVASSFPFVQLGETAVGDFEVTIERSATTVEVPEVTEEEAPVLAADVIEGDLTENEPALEYTFSGEEGETVIISLDSDEFDPYLRLLDDQGNELASNDDSNGTLNSQIGPFTLPYTGEYTVVATSFSFNQLGEPISGAFALTIESISITTIAYGEVNTVTFTPESSAQTFTIEGTSGDVLSVIVDSGNSVDTSVTITDVNGIVVAFDDDSGRGFDPEITRFVVPATGTYTVRLETFNAGDEGEASIVIEKVGAQSLDDAPRTITLNNKQFSDIVTLTGNAEEAIQLNLSVLDGKPGGVTVTVLQGEQTLMTYTTTFGLPESILLGFVVPADGDVTVIVEDFSGATSTLELSISR